MVNKSIFTKANCLACVPPCALSVLYHTLGRRLMNVWALGSQNGRHCGKAWEEIFEPIETLSPPNN